MCWCACRYWYIHCTIVHNVHNVRIQAVCCYTYYLYLIGWLANRQVGQHARNSIRHSLNRLRTASSISTVRIIILLFNAKHPNKRNKNWLLGISYFDETEHKNSSVTMATVKTTICWWYSYLACLNCDVSFEYVRQICLIRQINMCTSERIVFWNWNQNIRSAINHFILHFVSLAIYVTLGALCHSSLFSVRW